MKFYRIFHRSLIQDLNEYPQTGAYINDGTAHILAFNSFAMAVLEHPFFKLVLGFPSTFFIATYLISDSSTKQITDSSGPLYRGNAIGNRRLGRWANTFLQNNTALIAEFQSRDWPSQSNYIINVHHPLFVNVMIEEISAIQ